MGFGGVSFPRRVQSLYRRPTDLTPFPLLISAVILVYYKNNTRLNFGSVAAQITLPQLGVLTFNSSFHPNSVS